MVGIEFKREYKHPLYLTHRHITDLKDMLYTSAEIYANNNAFLVKRDGVYQPVKYPEFRKIVDEVGTGLLNMGLKGKRIGVIGENRYEWAIAYLAVVCGAGIVVPIDKELPAAEINNLVQTSEMDAVIYSPKLQKVVDEVNVGIKIDMEKALYEIADKGRELIAGGDTSYIEAEIDPEEMQILLFTSGTTSSAKAVMLSHKNIISNLMAMSTMIAVDQHCVFLSVLPLHHTYECTCGFLCPMHIGACVAHSDGLRYVAKNLKEAQATIVLGVPLLFETMYNRIWKQAEKGGRAGKLRFGIKLTRFLCKFGIDIRKKVFAEIHETFGGKLHFMISGAAGVDPKIAQGLSDMGFVVLQGYGLTECSPIAAVNRDVFHHDAAAGMVLPNVDVKIDNPDENGVGEILIRGENVMMGYYKNPEMTAEVIKDGWFYSGDLGYMDKDMFVYITGRKKNVIVTKNGKNIFPEELETHLCRSPYVQEVVVYGEDTPDGDTDVVAWIYPCEEEVTAKLGEGYSEDALKALLDEAVLEVNHSLQNYKRIAKIVIKKEEFEKTTTKKIKRYAVNK